MGGGPLSVSFFFFSFPVLFPASFLFAGRTSLGVKVKEELSFSLMSVFKIQDVAEDVLAEIVVHEIFYI